MEYLYPILYYGYYALTYYFYIIVITVILSWTPLVKTGFYQVLLKITAPYMNIFRGWIVISNMDFTPMLGFILYQIMLNFIARLL
jgi:uncharacterized protein YggT (Ycf19 family)